MALFLSVVLEDGEIPEPLSGGSDSAKALVPLMGVLKQMAQELGLRPLTDFVVDHHARMAQIFADESLTDIDDIDEAINEASADGPWFDPEEGLRTVHGLIGHIDGDESTDEKTREAMLTVLRSLAWELEYAKEQGTRFYLGCAE